MTIYGELGNRGEMKGKDDLEIQPSEFQMTTFWSGFQMQNIGLKFPWVKFGPNPNPFNCQTWYLGQFHRFK